MGSGWWQCGQEAWRAGEGRHQTWEAGTVWFKPCVTRWVHSQQEEEAVRCECGEDKHRNQHAAGKGWRNTLGLTAWGTETARVWELRLESSWGSSRLCIKTTGEMDLQGNCWVSNHQCWRKSLGSDMLAWDWSCLCKRLWTRWFNEQGGYGQYVRRFQRRWTRAKEWSMQPEATGRHRNQRDSLNKCPRAMRRLTRWTWEGLWHEGPKQELSEKSKRAKVSRGVKTGQRGRS